MPDVERHGLPGEGVAAIAVGELRDEEVVADRLIARSGVPWKVARSPGKRARKHLTC
jgi:hypothetical protein